MLCPECGAENLAGVDECEECLSPLTEIGMPLAKGGLQKRLVEEPVKNLLRLEPIFVKPTDSLQTAIELMQKNHRGCVLVREGGKLVGIFTERDCLMKLAGKNLDLKKIPVQSYMTQDPEVLHPNHSMAYALNKMSVGGYRHLPILEGNRVTGAIAFRDLLLYFWG